MDLLAAFNISSGGAATAAARRESRRRLGVSARVHMHVTQILSDVPDLRAWRFVSVQLFELLTSAWKIYKRTRVFHARVIPRNHFPRTSDSTQSLSTHE